MRLKIALLLAIAAAFLSFGASAQAARTVTITPQNPNPGFYYTPYADGQGFWFGSYVITPNFSEQYQYKAWDYLVIDSSSVYRSTCAQLQAAGRNCAFRDAADEDYGSENGLLPPNQGVQNGAGTPAANTPSACPYHGFHWFGHQVYYTWRWYNPTTHVWSGWSPAVFSIASSGVYGQVCL